MSTEKLLCTSCCGVLYHEESHGAPSVDGPILNVGLVSQVVRRLDGNLHPLDGQEGCQIGRVRGDDDQSECPPIRGKQGREKKKRDQVL